MYGDKPAGSNTLSPKKIKKKGKKSLAKPLKPAEKS